MFLLKRIANFSQHDTSTWALGRASQLPENPA
jgi:hypothetical protein